MPGKVVRSLVFPLDGVDLRLVAAMGSFRLATNRAIRFALDRDVRSRARFGREGGYRMLAEAHRSIHSQHVLGAIEVALAALKNHRRLVRKGRRANVPFVKRLFLKTTAQAYWMDPANGVLAVPIRAGEWVRIPIPVSDWHRSILEDPTWKRGSLTLLPDRAIVAMTRAAPTPYEPQAAIALDTNETSLDGVIATADAERLVTIPFFDVPVIQATHFRRRRRLAKKKANDRRVSRNLQAREGRRERNRVRQRLHLVSKRLVEAALAAKAAIVLEDLRGLRATGRRRRRNRRLNAWPRRELHHQTEYKAQAAGVPIIKINPAYTSKTCPPCGERQRRDRAGPKGRKTAAGPDAPAGASRRTFECTACGWRMDRQFNAGLNILKTARAGNPVLARAVRFRPDALPKDAMKPLYDPWPIGQGRTGQAEGSGVANPSEGPRLAHPPI